MSAQYTDAQIEEIDNLVYSTRPNYHHIQYSSENTVATDTTLDSLKLSLDVVLPPNPQNRALPLLIFVHGGGFKRGDKHDQREDARTYARFGYITATVNYRLTPQEFQEEGFNQQEMAITDANADVMNAVRFLKSRAGAWNIDTTRIAMMGKSAGGFITLSIAIAGNSYNGSVSDYPGISSNIDAAVSTGASFNEYFWPYLTFEPTDAPVLLFHADQTDAVTGLTWTGNAIPTANAINNSGNHCTLVAQPNLSHTIDISPYSAYWNHIISFLWSNLHLDADTK